ncbi:MAG TPA: complex I subunit 1 family protein [Candidatus Thermoplasmatota archaeon]|nr:complex I subunit 1 family protein [Candidatus Thermoplasmatota archaeon]
MVRGTGVGGIDLFLALVYLLVFPGVVFLFMFSLFTEYMDRKLYARIQRRVGPPFFQPFADLVKLASKEDVLPGKAEGFMFTAAPIFAVAAIFAAFLYLPVVSTTGLHSFNGDLVVVLYLLMIPTLALFLGGWYSGNVFGQKGGMRVASLLFSYEIPFFLALLSPALVVGSWKMADIILFQQTQPLALVIGVLGFVIAIVSLQGKLERLPFDIPEAETEIVAGPLVEYSGRRLALFRLARDAEMVVGAGLITAVFLGGPLPLVSLQPVFLSWIVAAVVFLLKTLFVILLLILIKSAVARIRTDQMISFAYRWLIPLTFIQIFLIIIIRAAGWIS